MRAMSFKGLVLLFALAVPLASAQPEGSSDRQVAAVADNIEWVSGLTDGLGSLAPPPRVVPLAPLAPRHAKGRPTKGKAPAATAAAVPVAAAAPAFVGRHLKLKKSTAFGIFDLTVDETSARSFDLNIASAEPAENIQVKDQNTKAIYVDKPLDDEKYFAVHVTAPLSSTIAVSVSVLQNGDINKAFFSLLGDDK